MWICLCKGVTDRRIRELIRAGVRTVEGIGRETGAGTDCGDCVGAIRDLLDQELEQVEGEVSGKSGDAAADP